MWINILSNGVVDEKWNKLTMTSDWKIILRLKSWWIRNIGKVKKDKFGYYVEVKRSEEHYVECMRGWWFNYCLIKTLPEDMRIVVKNSWRLKYLITAWMILKSWKFLHFLQQGFEKQLFIEKSMFWLY